MKIQTIHGELDESELERRESTAEGGQRIVEYYRKGELVHRSVETGLTPLDPAGASTASFG